MATDRFVYRNAKGQVILHTENDGWSYLRRGAEAREYILTLNSDGEVLCDGEHCSMYGAAIDRAKELLRTRT